MKKCLLLLSSFAIPLGACSTVDGVAGGIMPSTIEPIVDNGGKCVLKDGDVFIGKEATVELGTNAVQKSGASRLRWLPPRTIITMEYRDDRLNIVYDDNMIVTAVKCG